jgi:hypothetical protein
VGKRKYTRSAKTDAQRRGAAFKHGQYAATALTRTVHPCKRSLCPLSGENGDGFDGCATRKGVEEQGRVLEACIVELVINPETRQRYLRALQDGDLEGLQESAATFFAAMSGLSASELAKVQREGLAIDYEIFNKDGDNVGTGVKVNPRVEPLQKFLEMLGLTAAQHAITPKSAGEKKRDDGIGNTLDFYARRAALAAGPKLVG